MIEFRGEISGECKKFIVNRQRKYELIATFIPAIIFLILIVIVALNWELVALIFAIVPILLPVMALFDKIDVKRIAPTRVFIQDGYITSENQHLGFEKNINDIEEVVDMGEWYNIVFCYEERNKFFICQKSLFKKLFLLYTC